MQNATIPKKEHTWYGHEELHGVPVSVEAELGVRHVAVGDEAGRRELLAPGVRVDADHTPGQPRGAGPRHSAARAARGPGGRA